MSDMIRQTDRYLDDELSDEELAELFQWVGANAANADQFARQTMIDQHTSELLCGGDLLSPTRLSNTDQQASPIQAKPWRAHLRSPRRIAWVAAFATTALLLIAALAFAHRLCMSQVVSRKGFLRSPVRL